MRNDVLMRLIQRNEPIPRYTVVVPQYLTEQVLKGVYGSPFAGHLGVTKTNDRLRNRFYWTRMRESVQAYTR